MKRCLFCSGLVIFILFHHHAISQNFAQGFELIPSKKKSTVIPFKFVHNLILVPVRINDSDTLQFILDTGVTTALVTSLPNNEVLSLKYTKEVELSGLGGDADFIKALFSTGNTFQVQNAKGHNQDVLLLMSDIFHLSQSMGVHVHGLLGFELFNNFVVEINYLKRHIVLHDQQEFNKKKKPKKLGYRIPISIERKKPYVMAEVLQEDGEVIPVKLLIDSGASNALSLYISTNERLQVPEKTIYSFLGSGLNGDIFGDIGRIKALKLGKFNFEEPVVSYPEEEGIKRALVMSDRNGSLGAEILKRFTITFNYANNEVYFKPNAWYKEGFRYNTSGIEVSTPFPGLPVYEVAKVREHSPAHLAGIMRGDQIMLVNGMNASRYSLNEMIDILQNKSGKKVRLVMQRRGYPFKCEIILEDVFANMF